MRSAVSWHEADVAGPVAVLLADAAEAAQVDEHRVEGGLVALAAGDLLAQALLAGAARVHPRHVVEVGEALDARAPALEEFQDVLRAAHEAAGVVVEARAGICGALPSSRYCFIAADDMTTGASSPWCSQSIAMKPPR